MFLQVASRCALLLLADPRFLGLPSLHPISSHLLVLSVLPLTLSSSRIALLHAPLAIELLTVCKLLSGLLVFVWLIVLLLFAFVVLFVVFQSQHVQQVFERLFFTVFYTQYEEQMESSYTWLWGVFVVMMVLLFNAMVGSIAANYPEMKKGEVAPCCTLFAVIPTSLPLAQLLRKTFG